MALLIHVLVPCRRCVLKSLNGRRGLILNLAGRFSGFLQLLIFHRLNLELGWRVFWFPPKI
ncbi:hypothetical protein DVH24_013398 [Malus domestica]|uniref:Uncharacterized protein n=1 Tax=Malus domestica TaxID=3750 RepID=A0A498HL72_MALDO|nr:hypothetical protein DVH24_013398 [Malus domestica]